MNVNTQESRRGRHSDGRSAIASAPWGQCQDCDRERLRRVRARHTAPEITVRRMLHLLGYRFRVHGTDLPGKPDLVFPRRRKVIFVHGCFWHRHGCRKGRSTPNSNRQLWERKFAQNTNRDRRAKRLLRKNGWKSLVIWECHLRKTDYARLTERIRRFLQ